MLYVAQISRWIGILLCVLLGQLADARAAHAQTSTNSAEAEVLLVTPLSFVKHRDLDFGSIVPGPTPGFVTLSPDNEVTISGGIRAHTGKTQPATFYGYGTYRQRVRINIDSIRYFLKREGGNETMRLDRITISSAPPAVVGTNPQIFVIGNPDGYFGFGLGGRLRVGANQSPGVYTGKIIVTLEYL